MNKINSQTKKENVERIINHIIERNNHLQFEDIIRNMNDSNKTERIIQQRENTKTQREIRINKFLKLLIIIILIANFFGYVGNEEIKILELFFSLFI